jgi:hypothetical protein
MLRIGYVGAVLTAVSLVTFIDAQTIDDVSQLHKTVMSGYNKDIRPAIDQSQPVFVNVSFELISIRELDEIMEKISIVGILWMFWEDPRISWDPLAYNNTFMTKISNQNVWKPDLILAHPIDMTKAIGFDHSWYPVRYNYKGIALWAPGDVMTTTCNIDITFYPFDKQSCEVTFIPWGSRKSEMFIHIAEKEVSRKLFSENGVWKLKKATTVTGLIDNMYPTYSVVIELQRRPTYIIVNAVLPVLFMGLLNALVFYLPANSGERVSFAITILLAIAVFLTLVGDNMPKTSQPMSILCYFLLTNLVLSSLIMVVTVVNLRIYYKETEVPRWLRSCVFILKCKRKFRNTNDTKVDALTESKDADVKKSPEVVVKDNWVTEYDDTESITWRDVSETVDLVFGISAIVWLCLTALVFFSMVSTQSLPEN